jgi:hypothetical protein
VIQAVSPTGILKGTKGVLLTDIGTKGAQLADIFIITFSLTTTGEQISSNLTGETSAFVSSKSFSCSNSEDLVSSSWLFASIASSVFY